MPLSNLAIGKSAAVSKLRHQLCDGFGVKRLVKECDPYSIYDVLIKFPPEYSRDRSTIAAEN